jgi:hypothetical protein
VTKFVKDPIYRTKVIVHKGNIVCPANSYSFRATALIFCRMFIHIMEVCMSTGF